MNIKKVFRYAIKRGTGEAYLILKKYPKVDFSVEILRSVLSTYGYDAQSEGTRERYYYDLVMLSTNRERLIYRIIDALKKERRDTWAIEQLFNLCALFAKDGNSIARTVIYDQYLRKKVDDTPWLGEAAIVKMDGFKGVLFIAEYYGKLMQKDPNVYTSTGFLYHTSRHQENLYLKRLKQYSRHNNNIKKYLAVYMKDNSMSYPKKTKTDYEYYKQRINSNNLFSVWPLLRKNKSKGIVSRIADDFVNESDFKNKIKYLKFFRFVKFPYNYTNLLELARKIRSNSNREIEFVVESLKFFRNSEIRDFAIDKLKSVNNSSLYLGLLVQNYQKGDVKYIYNIVKNRNSPDKAHSVVWSIAEIYYKHKMKESKKVLEFLYSHLACGPHRYDVVKIMKSSNILSKKIRTEIRYDSYLKTRQLADAETSSA